MKHWGIDLGGTKTEVVVVHEGRVRIRRRVPTNGDRGYESLLLNIKQLIDAAASDLGSSPEVIGFATPGSVSPTSGLLRNSNTTCLNGRPFVEDLRAILNVDVRIANDANCFALAEARWGAGREVGPSETLLGLIIGTGVGAGIVVRDRIVVGANGNAGEWGHNKLDLDGRPCYCGRRGCVETVISGPALENFYESLSGRRLSLGDISKSTVHDEIARATIDRLLSKFGEAISSVINILDPDVIVIGGGVGNIPQLYEKWPEYSLPYLFNGHENEISTRLLKPLLGDSAGVFGAAALTGDFNLEIADL